MKVNQLTKCLMVAAAVGILFTACKKNKDEEPITPADDTYQQSMSAEDQTRVENESNLSMDDVSLAVEGVWSTKSANSLPSCGVSVDTVNTANTGLITLTYDDSTNCNGRARSGIIKIQLPFISGAITKWRYAGSKITLTYINYKITRLSDNKSLTFNGMHSVENVSGGLLINITSGNSLVHKIRGNMVLTFDDGSQRTWGAARIRTFSIANNIVSAQLAADTTINGNLVAMWGTNRANQSFSIGIPTPVVVNIFGGTCLYKPLSGQRVHYGLSRTITVTYGVDANGNAASGCPYGYKINWTNVQGVAKQVVRSY